MEPDNTQNRIDEWIDMYKALRIISNEQASLVEAENDRDKLIIRLESLHKRWLDQQNRIINHETELKKSLPFEKIRWIFEENIKPLLIEIQRDIQIADNQLKELRNEIGGSMIRSANFRSASNVYNTAGIVEDIAIYFDEKK